MQHLRALKSLNAYNNRITALPAGLLHIPGLRSVSIEGNPLTPASLAALLERLPRETHEGDASPDLRIAIDESQVRAYGSSNVPASTSPCVCVCVCAVVTIQG